MTKTTKNERAKIVTDMAAFMIENEGNCTRDTLMLQFTPAEIDAHAVAARTQANAALQRAA